MREHIEFVMLHPDYNDDNILVGLADNCVYYPYSIGPYFHKRGMMKYGDTEVIDNTRRSYFHNESFTEFLESLGRLLGEKYKNESELGKGVAVLAKESGYIVSHRQIRKMRFSYKTLKISKHIKKITDAIDRLKDMYPELPNPQCMFRESCELLVIAENHYAQMNNVRKERKTKLIRRALRCAESAYADLKEK